MKKIVIILLLALIPLSAFADSCWVLCQPDSWVNIRLHPRKNSEIIGIMELGDELETDGILKNGFLHLTGLALESSEGWVSMGFITMHEVRVYRFDTEIRSLGRVACRRSVKGTRRKWLKDGQKISVFAYADDWAVTNQGFIQTKYLEGF